MKSEDKAWTIFGVIFALTAILTIGSCAHRDSIERGKTERACIERGHMSIGPDCIPPTR